MVGRSDVIVGSVVVALGAWALTSALGMAFFFSGAPGPGFFPAFISALLVALGAALILSALRPKPAHNLLDSVSPAPIESHDDGEPDYRRVVKVAGGWIASIALIGYLGFVPAMALLVLYLSTFVEGKRGWQAPLAAVLIPVLSYLAFARLLHVRLPVGPLGY